MISIELYNKLVNISSDSNLNSTNFLESLQFRNNAFILIDQIKKFEKIFNSKATLYPSFKGNTAVENGTVVLYDEQELFFECLNFSFDEYNNEEIFQKIKDSFNFDNHLNKIIYDSNEDKISMFLCTDRYLNDNNITKNECEFFIFI